MDSRRPVFREPLETATASRDHSPRVRGRIDKLLNRALDAVERDGVIVDGRPHPMLATISDLVEAGTGMRRLALDRKAFSDDLAERERLGIRGEVEYR